MIKQLNIKTLLSVLIVGEIMTTSAGILSHMSTEEIVMIIAGFAGVWMIFILACFWIDSIVKVEL